MLRDITPPAFLDSLEPITLEKAQSLNGGTSSTGNVASPTDPSTLSAAHQWLKTDYERIKHERDMLSKAFRVFSQQMTYPD